MTPTPETLTELADELDSDKHSPEFFATVVRKHVVAWKASEQARQRADNAMRQALSDLEWIEGQVPGTNMQASILLLRDALAQTKDWPPERLVMDGDDNPIRVPYENLCPECNRVTNGRRCAHCQGE